MSQEKWYKSSKKKPKMNEIVWGIFKNRNVELVQLALTEKEYHEYFDGYYECSWYSLESEKTGSVKFWMPLKKPKRIFEDEK